MSGLMVLLLLLLEVGVLAGVKGRMGRRYLERVQRMAETALQSWDLHAKAISSSYRILTPLKGAGLIHYEALVEGATRLRHVAAVRIRIGGLLRVLTLTIVPSYRYNLPFFVLDLVCLGSRRFAAIEVIDPAPLDAEHHPKDYPQLRACKASAVARFPTRKPLGGAGVTGVLQDCSVLMRTDDRHERELLAVIQDYLSTWLKLVQDAPSVPSEERQQMKAGVEGFVRTLRDEGSPIISFERYLMGPQKLDRWLSRVVFGTDAA